MYGSRYPFAQVIAFKKDLAKFMDVKPDEVLLTHGSAEAIRATIEAEATKNTVLVQPELTYGDGADVAKRNNILVKNVKMGPDWSIDLAALRKVAAAEAKKHREQPDFHDCRQQRNLQLDQISAEEYLLHSRRGLCRVRQRSVL